MMEKIMNQYDKEYMKMAMLKHEETFREQVHELHRLYRIQKMLMKDIEKNSRNDHQQPEARLCLDMERPVGERKKISDLGRKCSIVSDVETDLELTLGPTSYRQRKIKASGLARQSEPGPSFSSSSTGSSQSKRTRSSTREETLNWGAREMPVSNQDRLNNNPHWIFRALSLNMT